MGNNFLFFGNGGSCTPQFTFLGYTVEQSKADPTVGEADSYSIVRRCSTETLYNRATSCDQLDDGFPYLTDISGQINGGTYFNIAGAVTGYSGWTLESEDATIIQPYGSEMFSIKREYISYGIPQVRFSDEFPAVSLTQLSSNTSGPWFDSISWKTGTAPSKAVTIYDPADEESTFLRQDRSKQLVLVRRISHYDTTAFVWNSCTIYSSASIKGNFNYSAADATPYSEPITVVGINGSSNFELISESITPTGTQGSKTSDLVQVWRSAGEDKDINTTYSVPEEE